MYCSTCGTLNCSIPINATLQGLYEIQGSIGGYVASLKDSKLHLLGISCQSHIEKREKQVRLKLATAEKQMTEMTGKDTGQLEKSILAMRIELGLECEAMEAQDE
jgi:hypothetical protein